MHFKLIIALVEDDKSDNMLKAVRASVVEDGKVDGLVSYTDMVLKGLFPNLLSFHYVMEHIER